MVSNLDNLNKSIASDSGYEPWKTDVIPSFIDASCVEPDWLFLSRLSPNSSTVSIEIIMYQKYKHENATGELNPWARQDIIDWTVIVHHSMDVPISWFETLDLASLRKNLLEQPFIADFQWDTAHSESLMKKGNQMVLSQPSRPLRMAVILTEITLVPPKKFYCQVPVRPEFIWNLDLRIIWAESYESRDASTRNYMSQWLKHRMTTVNKLIGGNSLESKLVYEGGSEDPIICSICLDEINIWSHVATIPCCHNFHGDCVYRWWTYKKTCPICRSPLTVPLF